MSEKRFKSTLDEDTMSIMPYLVSDNEEECFYNLQDCVDLLNEQQANIIKQDEEIKRLEKMIWKIQWKFQQEVGIEKAKEHYQEIDKEMED